MVNTCCAYNCKERFVKGSGITFHQFPKSEELKNTWLTNIQRENFVPNKYTTLCSKHFTEDSFDTEKFGGHWLKQNAVPTVFDFSKPLRKKRKPHKSEKLDERSSSSKSHSDESNEEPRQDHSSNESKPPDTTRKQTLPTPSRKQRFPKLDDPFNEDKSPRACVVKGCDSHIGDDSKIFYRFPSLIGCNGREFKNLCMLRRSKWIDAVKRGGITKKKFRNERICSNHFITGKPGRMTDKNDPDWVPTLNMGPRNTIQPSIIVHQQQGSNPEGVSEKTLENAVVDSQMFRCFLCDKHLLVEGASSLSTLTDTTKVPFRRKLDSMVADLVMGVTSNKDGLLCSSCVRVLNHVDCLEDELSSLNKVLLNTLLRKYDLDHVIECTESPNNFIEEVHFKLEQNRTEIHEAEKLTDGSILDLKNATSYLTQVRKTAGKHSHLYNNYLAILKMFKSHSIDTCDVMEKVTDLFKGHPNLIVGFMRFLPSEYIVDVLCNEQENADILFGNHLVSVVRPHRKKLRNSQAIESIETEVSKPMSEKFVPGDETSDDFTENSMEAVLQNTNNCIKTLRSELVPTKRQQYYRAKSVVSMSYLDEVKFTFGSESQTYDDFLDIVYKLHTQRMNTPDFIDKLINLFKDHPKLIIEFNKYLPPSYKIEVLGLKPHRLAYIRPPLWLSGQKFLDTDPEALDILALPEFFSGTVGLLERGQTQPCKDKCRTT
uniref:THAP-type domain-containing protein n=1 Tax=Timema monikensis TaxID=170555 RepID=A0A7R9E5D5_9NEOP|nr:unnamed protein product [Timema monikensis]